jgi:hypothetical protein
MLVHQHAHLGIKYIHLGMNGLSQKPFQSMSTISWHLLLMPVKCLVEATTLYGGVQEEHQYGHQMLHKLIAN